MIAYTSTLTIESTTYLQYIMSDWDNSRVQEP